MSNQLHQPKPGKFLFGRFNSRILLTGLAVIGLACMSFSAVSADMIKLSTGETLSGKVVKVEGGKVYFEHPLLGTLILDEAKVTIIPAATTAPSVDVSPVAVPQPSAVAVPTSQPATQPTSAPAAVEAAKPIEEKPEISFMTGWKRKFEAGVNGSEGNSRSTNLRIYGSTTRATDEMTTMFDAGYKYASAGGVKSASRFEANARNDWSFVGTPWGYFVKGTLEYDEFQNWQWRVSGNTGPTYTFIKDDRMLLLGRIGLGAEREIGGEHNEVIFQGVAGLDWTYKLTKRQNLYASVEYLPSLSNPPDYRLNSKAGWEIQVDPDVAMYLKLGAEDRYDSNPGGTAKRNDLDYFLAVGAAW